MKSQKYSRSSQAKLPALMQYDEKKYITLTKINEINYYLQSNFRSIQKHAKKSLVQYNENKNITLARTNELKHCLKLYFRSIKK